MWTEKPKQIHILHKYFGGLSKQQKPEPPKLEDFPLLNEQTESRANADFRGVLDAAAICVSGGGYPTCHPGREVGSEMGPANGAPASAEGAGAHMQTGDTPSPLPLFLQLGILGDFSSTRNGGFVLERFCVHLL